MQIKNIVVFSSTAAVSGGWIDISNLTNVSIQVVGLETDVWVEVSNDPNVTFDGPSGVLGAPVAPVLNQNVYGALANQGTYFVKTTYITKNGETTASPESVLAVNDGNHLVISSPAKDPLGIATGYNVYIGKTTGQEVLQTIPAYVPGWVFDNQPGIHYSTSGALPLGTPLVLNNGFFNSGIVPPVVDTSGSPNSGLNITGNLFGWAAPAVFGGVFVSTVGTISGMAMINPVHSWKWIRVCKSGIGTAPTIAYLFGQAT